MRGLIIAAAAQKRLQAIERWLCAQIGVQEMLIVAPTRGAADDLLRRSCAPAAVLFGCHRLTLAQLAADLATRALARDGRAPVSKLGSEAIAARAASIRAAAGELPYFAPVADAPGFARALARTLREVRRGGVTAGELDATGAPGEDLARLLVTYEEELGRWALVDDARLLELAGVELARGAHRLAGLPLVLLDLSPTALLEQRLLKALVERAPGVFATTVGGDVAGRAALEVVCGVAARDLDAADGDRPDDGAGTPPATRLERLRQRIFLPRLAADEPPPEDDASIAFLSAPGEGRECVEIARRVRQLAAEGVPFDQIAVLLRDPDSYLPLVEEALRRAEIPAYYTRGTTRPHPAGRALLALLACAAERLSASRFAEYLSLGQVPYLDAAGAPPVVEVPWVAPEGDQLVFKTLLPATPPAPPTAAFAETDEDPVIAGTLRTPRRWERLLVDAAVLGGKDRWRRRLDGLAAEIRLKLRHLESDDHPRRGRLERQLEQLENLQRFALPVIAALAALPAQATWGEWLAELEALCGRVLREPERVLTILAELRPMDRVGPVPLDEVRRVLEERLTFLRAEPPDRRYGHVFVATVDEARGRAFAAVFLPGLAEGIFPRRAAEDPLLLDAWRRALDARLPTQPERVEEERLLLRIAAGAARSRLVVSYPNLDALEGRARVPSFYALDLLRAAEGRLPDLQQLERRAAGASQSLLGWPAPRRPETAVDDAEYDLAVLEPLLRQGAAEVRGKGRYLLESNDRLTRSLRARYLRWRKGFSAADGVVEPDAATLAALAPERLHARSYSPTALQHYAACPYRFLLAAIHKLRPREEVEWLEQLDPLTRGSLFHEVQRELFTACRERSLLPMREDDLAGLLELADRTLDRVAERYAEELAPAIPRVWASEVEGLRTDLRGWIRAVVDAAEPWRPTWFELAFGLDRDAAAAAGDDGEGGEEPPAASAGGQPALDFGAGAAPPSAAAAPAVPSPREAVVLDGKRLRGAIDLVEVHPERGTLRVTDHKTGLVRVKKDLVVGGGETLQPLLYALAAEHHLGRPAESGRLFYCTRRGRYESVEVPVDERNRQAVSLVLDVVDRALVDGFLPAAPREGACRYCDYRQVCGPHEERRIQRKHPQRLVLLRQLRELP